MGERRSRATGSALFNLYTGAADSIEGVDTVVLATGQKANDELYFALKGDGRETCTGSATASRRASSTTRSTRASSPAASCGRPEERYIYEGELERWEEVTVGAPA